jgi:hypothetical protein
MIKRIIGWLFTIATIAIVVLAILNIGNYKSMCVNCNKTVDQQSHITTSETTTEDGTNGTTESNQ